MRVGVFAVVSACVAGAVGAVGCACGPGNGDAGDAAPGTDGALSDADAGPPPPCALAVSAKSPTGGDAAKSPTGDARVIAVGYHFLLAHAESYEAWRAAMTDLMENVVGPCLAAGAPNLVVFPEDTLLVAALIGSRAAVARVSSTSLLAFAQLHGGYADAVTYYNALYPGLSFNQQVVLVPTDTVMRALAVFPELAVTWGAWIAVTGNVPDAVLSSDAADLAALTDPDLDPPPSDVWVAVAPEVYNQTFFYGPDGAEIARVRKVYLTGVEIGLLQLGFGDLDALAPVDLGFARVGTVISKDAWMPDVLDRLAMRSADLLIQPEAFSGWTVPEVAGEWNPDVVMESGWSHVQKYVEFRYSAMASLTGNLIDLIFDAQGHVAEDGAGLVAGGAAEATLGAYVGNDLAPGMRDVGAWAIPDPGIATPALTLAERRAMLEAYGETLLPGGANENAYAASHAAADLSLPPDGVFSAVDPTGVGPIALGDSMVVSDWTSAVQSHPDVAVGAGDRVYVVWADLRTGPRRVFFSRSDDAGASWTTLVPVAFAGSGSGDQSEPVIAANGDEVHVAWQELGGASEPSVSRVWTARSLDGGATWEAPIELAGAGAGAPPGPRWQPAIAVDAATVAVALVATETAPYPRTRIWLAASDDAGVTFSASAVDVAGPPASERNLGNQWSPAVATLPGGAIVASWIDFRDYSWDVYAARTTDLGLAWSVPARVDDGGSATERLHDDVAAAVGPAGELFLAWTHLHDRGPAYGVRGTRFEALPAVPPPSLALGTGALARWAPDVAFAPDGRLVAAWQDFRDGTNDVYLSVSTDGGASFGPALRLDDDGDALAHAFAPRLAVSAAGLVHAVWIDTRTSFPRVRHAAGPVP